MPGLRDLLLGLAVRKAFPSTPQGDIQEGKSLRCSSHTPGPQGQLRINPPPQAEYPARSDKERFADGQRPTAYTR